MPQSFTRLAQFVVDEMQRQIDQEGFDPNDGHSLIVFDYIALAHDHPRSPDTASVRCMMRWDTLFITTHTETTEQGYFVHNDVEYVIHDREKVVDILAESLAWVHERAAALHYDRPRSSMRVDVVSDDGGRMRIDCRHVTLPGSSFAP